jgi:hypothetical protein
VSADLVTWLRAALDDDQRAAESASPGPWHPNAESDEVWAVDDVPVAEGFALSGNQLRATVVHIVRWDPVRVLAEVAAKRAILDEVARWQHDYIPEDAWYSCAQAVDSQAGEPGSGCLDDSRAGKGCDCGLDQRRTRVLGPLAQVYRDRAGFDPSWLD